jgi:hypothetical protein
MKNTVSILSLIVFNYLTYYISSFLDNNGGDGYMKFSVIFIVIGGLIFYFLSKRDTSEKYEDVIVSSRITFDPKPVKHKNIINSFVVSSSIFFSFIVVWKLLCSLFDPSFILVLTDTGPGWILSIVTVWYITSLIGSKIWGCSKGKVFRMTGLYIFITISWMFWLYGYFGKFSGLFGF